MIVAPKRCYEPEALLAGKKLWGACVQLYTLRSENNWGIGDFGDLGTLVSEVAARGGAFVGLNPIHALYPGNPEAASPYSPSSRRWLNVIYIDVDAVADFQQSEAAQRWWQAAETQTCSTGGARHRLGGLRARHGAKTEGAASGLRAIYGAQRAVMRSARRLPAL